MARNLWRTIKRLKNANLLLGKTRVNVENLFTVRSFVYFGHRGEHIAEWELIFGSPLKARRTSMKMASGVVASTCNMESRTFETTPPRLIRCNQIQANRKWSNDWIVKTATVHFRRVGQQPQNGLQEIFQRHFTQNFAENSQIDVQSTRKSEERCYKKKWRPRSGAP